MSRSARRNRQQINTWPGYVDVLSALLILVIFVLLLFTFSQFILSHVLNSKESELDLLNQQLLDLTEQLGLEHTKREGLQREVEQLSGMVTGLTGEKYNLSNQLAENEQERSDQQEKIRQQLLTLQQLQADITMLRSLRTTLKEKVEQLALTLAARDQALLSEQDRSKALILQLSDSTKQVFQSQRQINEHKGTLSELNMVVENQRTAIQQHQELGLQAQAQVAHLNSQIDALRFQLEELSAALDIREKEKVDQQVKIEDLGRRLNLALAQEVNRLAEYRSEFFGRLKSLLSDTKGVQVVGDRFVLQSELLFDSGSANLGPSGQGELTKLAEILVGVAARIPKDIEWILRVDGHTDKQPIHTEQFPSNWELSTARAVSVVRFLVEQGISRKRLTAAGFAQFHPIDTNESEAAFRRNRRIELKLTAR